MPAVSRAVALGVVDTVLTKPTGPRDEEFHTAITEDLGEWAWTTAPVVEAVRIVGADDRPRAGDPRGARSARRTQRPPPPRLGRRQRDRRARRPGSAWHTLVEVMGTDGPRRPHQPAAGRRLRRHRRRRLDGVRPGRRRRRSGRVGGGRVRRLRGPLHAGARGRGVRRAGRHELDDPQLPRLPSRHHRPAARPARRPPGVVLRRRVRPGPGRHRSRTRSAAPPRPRRWRRRPPPTP